MLPDPQNPRGIIEYLKQQLPSPETHKLYFDHGTETLDAKYPPYQAIVDSVIREAGYMGDHLKSLEFKGDKHDEDSWAERLLYSSSVLAGEVICRGYV